MNKKKEPIEKIINLHTGEYRDIFQGDTVKIIRKNSKDNYNKSQKKKKESEKNTIKWSEESFFKGFNNELQLINNELNNNEKIFLYSIIPYISYEDNSIKDKYQDSIGTEQLKNICGIARRSVYQTISSLIDKNIIYKEDNGKSKKYYINPWLFCMGNTINKELYQYFKDYKIKSLEITWEEYLKGGET